MLKEKTITDNRVFKTDDGKNAIELTFSDKKKFVMITSGEIDWAMYCPIEKRWGTVHQGNIR